MGKDSRIEWTHHTFNPWWGCTKVSPACKHCYAETWAKRVGAKVWGARSPRRFFSDHHWAEPIKWNRDALDDGARRRVFCASMADVFEDRRDLDRYRDRLWQLIAETPALDWLLLSKRPEHAARLGPLQTWPRNMWFGTTVETQAWAERRIPWLADVPVATKFVSCEPLLGAVDLVPWLGVSIHWVIAGGESGGKARASDPRWFQSLRDQCIAADTPFHFKQWGNWTPARNGDGSGSYRKCDMVRMSKVAAGRLLDGITWDQYPSEAPGNHD
jgi:protein gp37